MTSKTTVKNARPEAAGAPSPERIQTAYQVHTLAQLLYGELVTSYPHIAPPPVRGVSPVMGYPQASWPPQAWYGMWNYPTGWGG